jgi:hypothetical protein
MKSIHLVSETKTVLYKFVEVRLVAWLLSKLGATKMDGIGCSPKVHTHTHTQKSPFVWAMSLQTFYT